MSDDQAVRLIATSKSGKHRVNRQVAEAMKLGFMRKDVLRKGVVPARREGAC